MNKNELKNLLKHAAMMVEYLSIETRMETDLQDLPGLIQSLKTAAEELVPELKFKPLQPGQLTVRVLVEKLQQLPPNAPVEIDGYMGEGPAGPESVQFYAHKEGAYCSIG